MADITVLRVDPGGSDAAIPVDELEDAADVAVLHRETLAAAREAMSEHAVDCVVTEYDLPDGTGIELLSHVRETTPDTGCILCTNVDRDQVTDGDVPPHVVEFVRKDSPAASARVAQLVQTTARRRTQTAYPIPPDEDERLDALAAYDLDSERFLDAIKRIADLAARHFDVAQSSVNVIGERTQEFLACYGEHWDATAREDSVCAYAILSDGVTVVEDTRADPRFEGNELLDDLGVRFYAGANVTTEDGVTVGTVCIYDDEPRSFDDEDEQFLELLAADAADWFHVLRTEAADGDDESVDGADAASEADDLAGDNPAGGQR